MHSTYTSLKGGPQLFTCCGHLEENSGVGLHTTQHHVKAPGIICIIICMGEMVLQVPTKTHPLKKPVVQPRRRS